MQPSAAQPADFAVVYRTHYSFVWRTLRHLGVEPARVDDAVQDTFLVVYRRLSEFAGRAALRTWLFEIARRVASHYRRSAAREASRRGSLAEAEAAAPPIGGVERAETAELVQIFLAELDRDKAVVFVLAELEQWQAPEIADELAISLNTVYSRLRGARKQLDRLVRRFDARERRVDRRSGAQVLGALLVVGPPPPPAWRPGPARDPSVFSDMLLRTWSIEPVRSSVGLLAAGGNTAAGLSLAGAGVAALLAFGGAPRSSEPPPGTPTNRSEPAMTADDVPAATVAASPIPPESTEAPMPAAGPKPRPRAPVESSLAAELALIESLRAALQTADAHATLELVERHRRRFPGGLFAEEVAAAAIEARCRLGERDRARRDATAFFARWPTSSLAARVDALCRS